jgi:hypothetical protein
MYAAFCYLIEFGLLSLVLHSDEFSRGDSGSLALMVCGGTLLISTILALCGLRGFHPFEGIPLDIAVAGLVGIVVALRFTRGTAQRDMIIMHSLYALLVIIMIGNKLLLQSVVPTDV